MIELEELNAVVVIEGISEEEDESDANGEEVPGSVATLEPVALQYWRERKCIEGSATSKRNDMVLKGDCVKKAGEDQKRLGRERESEV